MFPWIVKRLSCLNHFSKTIIKNCLTFQRITLQPYTDNLCWLRALALQWHRSEKLEEETSKTFNIFLRNSEERDISNFQVVHLNDIPKSRRLVVTQNLPL